MLFNLTSLSDEPVHRQIARQLLEKILSDAGYDGSELPRPRVLASEQHVSVHTIERAYQALEKEGLLTSGGGARYLIPRFTPEEKAAIRRRYFGQMSPLNIIESLSQQLISVFDTEKLRQILEAVLEQHRRIEEELNMARQIQASLLPKSLPSNGHIAAAAYSRPSRTVGGDFYDFLALDERRIAFVIADACGKGLPAAMLISQIQAMIKSELNNGNPIEAVLDHLNRQLVDFTPRNKFVTLFLGILDKRSGIFQYAGAGQNHPFLISADGDITALDVGGPGLGIASRAVYNTGTIALHPGDVLFLYTDGVTETMDADREEYGEQRLQELLRQLRYNSPDELIDAVVNDLEQYYTGEILQDDRTILVVKMLSMRTT